MKQLTIFTYIDREKIKEKKQNAKICKWLKLRESSVSDRYDYYYSLVDKNK